MKGDPADILQAFTTAAIGVWFLAGSTEGWFGGKLALPLRVVLFFAALCLIVPETITDLVGIVIGGSIYVLQRIKMRQANV